MFVSGQSGCIQAKRLNSGTVVVFVQGCCIRVMWLYSGKSCCNRAKVVVMGQNWLYLDKSGCIRAKVVVIGQNWYKLGKVVIIG